MDTIRRFPCWLPKSLNDPRASAVSCEVVFTAHMSTHMSTHMNTQRSTHMSTFHIFNSMLSDKYIFKIKSAMSTTFAENNPKFSDSKQRDGKGNTEEGGPTLRLRLECSKAF